MGFPGAAQPLRVVAGLGSTRHQRRRQALAALTCGGLMGAHPALKQTCHTLQRWRHGLLQKAISQLCCPLADEKRVVLPPQLDISSIKYALRCI